MEYLYCPNPNAKVPVMLIDKHIGVNAKGEEGIMGDRFARELLSLKNSGKKEVQAWICSVGGNYLHGMMMHNAIKESGICDTVNMGAVDSTAGWVFQAGKKRIWNNYAVGLIHNVQNASTDGAEVFNNSVATLYAGKTKKSVEDIRALMEKDTIMNAQMAESYGFCDIVSNANTDISSISNSSDINEVFNFGQQQIKITLPKNKSMSKVDALLGLSNEASEDARATAIEKLVNENTANAAKVTELTASLTNSNTLLTETTAKLSEATAKIAEVENANKEAAADAMLKPHIGNRIANDPAIIASWKQMAIANIENTRVMIEAIPLNVAAPKPEAKALTATTTASPIVSAAQYMSAK